MTWLRDRWLELIAAAAGPASAGTVDPDTLASGSANPAAAGDDLIARWSEPQRHYHTLTHLERMLDVVDGHVAASDDPQAVALACWFHDAVYDPTRGDNEEASAMLAETVLSRLGVGPDLIGEVVRLVRLTADHAVADGDRNGALLVDADLAILATDASTYAAYTTAVRAEYSHVNDETFQPRPIGGPASPAGPAAAVPHARAARRMGGGGARQPQGRARCFGRRRPDALRRCAISRLRTRRAPRSTARGTSDSGMS